MRNLLARIVPNFDLIVVPGALFVAMAIGSAWPMRASANPVCATTPSITYGPGQPSYFNAYNGMHNACLANVASFNNVDRCNRTIDCFTMAGNLNRFKNDGTTCPSKMATAGKASDDYAGDWLSAVRPNQSCRFKLAYGGPNIWLGMPDRQVRFTNVGTGTCVLEERSSFDSVSNTIVKTTINPPQTLAPGQSIEFTDIDHCSDGEHAIFLCGEGGIVEISIPQADEYHTWSGSNPAPNAAVPPYSTHSDPFWVEIKRSCSGDPSNCTPSSNCPVKPPGGAAGDPDQPVLAPVD